MTGLRMKYLTLALTALGLTTAHAAGGDITRQESKGGSVELSNLGPEEAQVVVAAPPPGANKVETPAHRSPQVMPQARVTPRVQEAAASDQVRKPKQRKPECDSKDAENQDCETNGAENTADAAATGGDATRPAWAAASPYAPGYSFGGANGNGGYGGGSVGGGSTGTTAGGDGSGATGDTGATGNGGGATAGGTTGSPLDSPEALAARLVQYQQMMLNEQRGANGLVSNPAVQRRYLMLNRSTYNRLGL